jgi:hypothetical protein
LLADKLVELQPVPSISRETIRRTLKKRTTAAFKRILGHSARAQCLPSAKWRELIAMDG